MIVKVETVAAFDAQELAVDAGGIAIISANNFVIAHAERGLAPVRAVRANRPDVLHLPRTRLIAIRAAGQRADRANIDAHTALVAIEMVESIGLDLAGHATVVDAERAHAHALITNAHAAITKDAARLVVEHHRRPLLLIAMIFRFRIAALADAIAERH